MLADVCASVRWQTGKKDILSKKKNNSQEKWDKYKAAARDYKKAIQMVKP